MHISIRENRKGKYEVRVYDRKMNNVVHETFKTKGSANNWAKIIYPIMQPFPDCLIKVSEQPSCIGDGWSVIVYRGEMPMDICCAKNENDADRIAKELQIDGVEIVKSYADEAYIMGRKCNGLII